MIFFSRAYYDWLTPTSQICDFGLATEMDDFGVTGRVGKTFYMAPEVRGGEPYDGEKADGKAPEQNPTI